MNFAGSSEAVVEKGSAGHADPVFPRRGVDPQTLIWPLLCAHRPHAGDTRMHEAAGCLCPWGPQSQKTPLSVQGASSDLKHMGEGAAMSSPEAGFLFGVGRGVRAVLQHRRRDDWRVSGRRGHCGLTAPQGLPEAQPWRTRLALVAAITRPSAAWVSYRERTVLDQRASAGGDSALRPLGLEEQSW